jgi:hypothetical protein
MVYPHLLGTEESPRAVSSGIEYSLSSGFLTQGVPNHPNKYREGHSGRSRGKSGDKNPIHDPTSPK